MHAISRKVQNDGEVFEVDYNSQQIIFAVPLGAFEPSDILFLNADESLDTEAPEFDELRQSLADFAWDMRHPMRVEFFVSPELVPALVDNNFEGLDSPVKNRLKMWSARARQDNHDLFFTDGGTEREAICEVLSDTMMCRQIFAYYNLNAKLALLNDKAASAS